MLDENDSNLYKVNRRTVYSYWGESSEDDAYFNECYEIEREIFEKFEKYLYVKIYIDSEDEKFIKKYDQHIFEHNKNIMEKNSFELLCPTDIIIPPQDECGGDDYVDKEEGDNEDILKYSTRINFDVKCQCHIISANDTLWQPVATMLHPIPMNKLPNIFRPIDTIQPDYLGNLRIDLGCHANKEKVAIKKYDTIYQLLNIGLDPIYVERVISIEDLYTTKLRI